jgi:hypothetical protein
MAQPNSTTLVQLERITRSILVLRGQRVILDRELAAIYGVTTKRLNDGAGHAERLCNLAGTQLNRPQ